MPRRSWLTPASLLVSAPTNDDLIRLFSETMESSGRAGCWRGLQAQQIIGGALSMCGSLKDGVLVFGQDFEPVADIVGMVFPDFRGDAEVGTQERGAQFCDQLFAGIARVAETLAAEITIETCCVASRV